MRGTIVNLIQERGFGFVETPNGDRFFFQRGAMAGNDFEELAEGLDVEFDVHNDAKGDREGEHPRAINVRLADGVMPAADHEALPRQKTGG
jgi:cold shock CspA family protein